jgi:undecaprenyl diphosphate synthase
MIQLEYVPQHVALIPDGNRRWSRSHKFKLYSSYSLGIEKFINFSIWAKSFGVKTLTVWALSTENISNRSRGELSILYRLYTRMANDKKIFDTLKRNGARIIVIGNLSKVPKPVRTALYGLERRTKTFKELSINILIGYGGRDDIIHAVKRIISDRRMKIRNINENLIRAYLRTAALPDADLIIRTSGETRLSGFLPWQSGYSELYFANKYWPDFGKKDLERALKYFSTRQRRFGK